MRRMAKVWLIAAALITGCVSLGPLAVQVDTLRCEIEEAIAGTWTDTRLTQMGPAWVTYSLGCDCHYQVRIQLMWMRISERGRYQVAGGNIEFDRESGKQTITPYRLEGGQLYLTDAPGEVYAHHRKGEAVRCRP
jgi:hypothetical protein